MTLIRKAMMSLILMVTRILKNKAWTGMTWNVKQRQMTVERRGKVGTMTTLGGLPRGSSVAVDFAGPNQRKPKVA